MRDIHALFQLTVMTSLAALLACDANLGSVAVLETGSEDADDSSTDEPRKPIVCLGGELCPAGTRCANGLCAAECSDDPECEAGEYCGLDGLCHSETVPSCKANDDCAATQACVNQSCVALDQGCDPTDYLLDGCASNALCFAGDDGDDEGVCYELPACAADQTCPIGLEGAVCNIGYYPSKDEICLIGMCATAEHCPAMWRCIHFAESVLGSCSNGVFASPCTEHAHCLSGTCLFLPSFGGGFCA